MEGGEGEAGVVEWDDLKTIISLGGRCVDAYLREFVSSLSHMGFVFVC